MKKLIILIAVVLFSNMAVFGQSSDDKKVQPPNGLSALQAYYLFYSDYQNKNYKSALNNGRWLLKAMPAKIKGYPKYDLATNLDRFISIYSEMAKNTTDPSMKSAYIDTANSIFDTAFKKFSKDEIDYYQWHLNRGRLYQDNADFVENGKAKATEQYEKAFSLNPKKVTKTADGYYVRVLLQNLVSEGTEDSKKKALAIIKKVDGDANDDLSNYFDKVRSKLFDSPKEQMAFLEQKVEKNPDDQASLQKLRDIYEDQDMIDKAQKLNQKLYKLDPSYQNTTALANFAIQNANYKDAVKYLNEAKGKTDDPKKQEKIYESLAQAHLNNGDLKAARSSARNAIKKNSKAGEPYIIIANSYARTVNNCSSGRDLDRKDRAVYWLVMDYLNKAKRVDSSVSSQANNQLRTYRQAAPTKEDIFFMSDWKKGKSIQINSSLHSCYAWINESTTVR